MKKQLCLGLTLIGITNMSEAIVLDSFAVPYSRSISTGTYVDTMADPTIFGGHRDVQVKVIRESQGGSMHVVIANGKLAITTDPGVSGEVLLQYDGFGEEASNTGPGKLLVAYAIEGEHPLGEGTSSMRVHIDDAQFTRGISVGLNLYNNGTWENQIFRNPPRGASIISMGNPVIFAVNNAVETSFALGDGGDSIIVDRTELVPEAGAGLGFLAGLGALGLLGLRRKP